MNESALMVFLRLIHIILGVFWVGTVLFLAWFLIPAQRSAGQAGLVVMREVMMTRKMSVYLAIAMGLTVLSGLTMYARLAMITHGAWASTTDAKVLGFGALCGIVGGVIGASSGRSTGLRMAAIGQAIQQSGGPPTPAQTAELNALQENAQKKMRIVALLLVLAVAAMASARYL